MPKKRNTRKHKISIDQKRHTVDEVSTLNVTSSSTDMHSHQQVSATSEMTFSLPTEAIKTPISPRKSVSATVITTENYGYLTNDLLRTAVLTGAIIITELLIRLVYLH